MNCGMMELVDGLIAASEVVLLTWSLILSFELPGYIQHLMSILAVLKVSCEFCILS